MSEESEAVFSVVSDDDDSGEKFKKSDQVAFYSVNSAVWTGDNVATWEYLKISIPMLLSLSVTGVGFLRS
ncbi:unnamed protein product [Pleuronectes platessa]|uniref:Glycoside hydrolase family 31 TIM barrel domain-containing protein n=1 Tax=Pleuronectes platessa TaxID=8262 RepID=A0A9N7VHR6_PLEPL|nr:unnamed protein product [Pleuronectes platessa]